MLNPASYSAFGISMALHAVLLAGLWFVKYSLIDERPQIAVESIFTEDRVQEEFTKDLEVETEVAETFNTVAGGVVSTAIGSAVGPTINTTKIETSETLRDPEIKVNVGTITMPGDSMIGVDLGQGEVQGEVGAFVEGYGAALSQISQEIIRMMREQKVLVVWLFDESESMKDDQKEIRDKFHQVYEELGIASKNDAKLKKKGDQDVLLTMIHGFGKEIHPLLAKPTADIPEIQGAIDKIGIDESGAENTCMAIADAIQRYRQQSSRQKRKLVVVVVSDESGDDGEKIEETLQVAKAAGAPLYFLGREAIFGYPWARIRWKDPKYGLDHWLRIRRGPETAFRECLQWDGLHSRWDAFSSGFGPYEQVRLAKETGGIFFVLPGEEENLSGAGAREKRRFDALDMKEYEPLMVSRREYADQVTGNDFRETISKVIAVLDPAVDKQLEIREHWYPLENAKFREQAAKEVVKAARAMEGLDQVIPMLEKLKNKRPSEESQRWRANYDLMLAQLYNYRIRLFQYLLAMDDHANNMPKPKKPNTNTWNVGRSRKTIEPTEAQFDRLKKAFKLKVTREEYLADLKEQEAKAKEMYQFVIEEHPRTPWARRAQHELSMGFGMHFYEAYRNPNYDKLDIKFPNL